MGTRIETTKLEEIEIIMGSNFFGSNEYLKYYGDNLAKYQIPEIPIEPEMLLESCPFYKGKEKKETHSLILAVPEINGVPTSMMGLQELHPANKQPRYYSYDDDAWYKDEKFANTPVCEEPTWLLMLNEIAPGSTNKNWVEQQALLPKGYSVPTATQENLKVFCHYLTTGIYLNPRAYTRTKDIDSDGYRAVLGGFDEDGLDVNCSGWDESEYCFVGLATLRDFNWALAP